MNQYRCLRCKGVWEHDGASRIRLIPKTGAYAGFEIEISPWALFNCPHCASVMYEKVEAIKLKPAAVQLQLCATDQFNAL